MKEKKKKKKKKMKENNKKRSAAAPFVGTSRRGSTFRTTGEPLPHRLQKIKKRGERGETKQNNVTRRPTSVVEKVADHLFLRMYRDGKVEVLNHPDSKTPIQLDFLSGREAQWRFENVGRRLN